MRKKRTAGDRAWGSWEGLVFRGQQHWALGAGLSDTREALILFFGFLSFLDFGDWQPGGLPLGGGRGHERWLMKGSGRPARGPGEPQETLLHDFVPISPVFLPLCL